jgi:SET domain-containing protein
MLEVRETKHKGRAVYAARFIPRGAPVLTIGGKVLQTRDLGHDCAAMQIGEDLWLCSDGSLVDDCVNHSCQPNTGFLRHDPVLYALSDILPGQELTWDYSTSISEPTWKLECWCKRPGCRGLILPFHSLTPDQRAALDPIVLQYLRSGR